MPPATVFYPETKTSRIRPLTPEIRKTFSFASSPLEVPPTKRSLSPGMVEPRPRAVYGSATAPHLSEALHQLGPARSKCNFECVSSPIQVPPKKIARKIWNRFNISNQTKVEQFSMSSDHSDEEQRSRSHSISAEYDLLRSRSPVGSKPKPSNVPELSNVPQLPFPEGRNPL